jgi:hypothetical protein
MLQIRLGTMHCALVAGTALVLVACGGSPPPPARGVLEQNVSSWQFRRYQALQDVEVWVPDNEAVAHTASYVRGEAEKAGQLETRDVVNAFVTRYQSDEGIVHAVVKFARRLAQESGYVVEEGKKGGVRLIVITGPDEKWVLWPAPSHVVKIGGRELESVPTALIEAYGERYPSRLDSGMLEGPLPEEPAPDETPAQEPYDPDNPTPDWDKYDPDTNTPGGQRSKE